MLTKSEGFAVVASDDKLTKYIASADQTQVLELAAWIDARKNELFDAGADERFAKELEYWGDGIDYMIDGALSEGEEFFDSVVAGEDTPDENEGFVMYDLHDRAEELDLDIYDELDKFIGR